MAVGLLNPDKEKYNDRKDPLSSVEIPQMFYVCKRVECICAGVKDIIEGGYVTETARWRSRQQKK